MIRKVAILANGGDVSGFNAVIRAIVKTAEKEFSDCNKEKIVYANISDEFMNNDIFYKPYPTEILNHLSCVEMEVKD